MRKTQGFTLIEVLVSMVVMTIVMTAILASMMNFLQTSKRLNTMRSLQQETTFVLSRMSDKIRGFSIDYEAYDSGDCQTMNIASNEGLCLREGYRIEKDGHRLWLRWKDGTNTIHSAPLFSEKVLVQDVLFLGSPTQDPTNPGNWGNPLLQRQPRVDIILEVAALSDPSISYRVETTISSRVY